MSRVTAAFMCALCDPDNPRPASISCSNNCGRYVCAVHAVPRKGPGSAMFCLSCAEAMGVLDKPKPKPVAAPIISSPPTEARPTRIGASQPAEPFADLPLPNLAPRAEVAPETTPVNEPPAQVEAKPEWAFPTQPAPQVEAKFDPDVTLPGAMSIAKPAPTQIKPSVVPTEDQSSTVRRLSDPPLPPQASETIVSQRGNTLQVPKVTAPLPARPAKRASATLGGLDRQMLIMAAGSMVRGIAGFVMILAALAG